MRGHYAGVQLEEVKVCYSRVSQVAAETGDVDLTGAVKVKVAWKLVVQSVSDHYASSVLELDLQVINSDLGVVRMKLDRAD